MKDGCFLISTTEIHGRYYLIYVNYSVHSSFLEGIRRCVNDESPQQFRNEPLVISPLANQRLNMVGPNRQHIITYFGHYPLLISRPFVFSRNQTIRVNLTSSETVLLINLHDPSVRCFLPML